MIRKTDSQTIWLNVSFKFEASCNSAKELVAVRGKWAYLSMVGAFGLCYGLSFPLPVALAPPPKEHRSAIVQEEITPLEQGIRFVVNYFKQGNQPPPPRIARPPAPPPAPIPAVATEPAPPPQPARQFSEPPRANSQGFTALAVR